MPFVWPAPLPSGCRGGQGASAIGRGEGEEVDGAATESNMVNTAVGDIPDENVAGRADASHPVVPKLAKW